MRMYKGFNTKEEAKEFAKKKNGHVSYEKSDTEKRACSPSDIRDCKKWFGLDEKIKYVVIYTV